MADRAADPCGVGAGGALFSVSDGGEVSVRACGAEFTDPAGVYGQAAGTWLVADESAEVRGWRQFRGGSDRPVSSMGIAPVNVGASGGQRPEADGDEQTPRG